MKETPASLNKDYPSTSRGELDSFTGEELSPFESIYYLSTIPLGSIQYLYTFSAIRG